METVFTSARFIYRHTNMNIYGAVPVHVTALPDPTDESPTIVEFMSRMYEKCLYLDNAENSANFYFTDGNGMVRNVSVTPSEDFATVKRYGNYFTVTADENTSTAYRTATVVAVSNTSTVTFKLFQDGVDKQLAFTAIEEYRYRSANDSEPTGQPSTTPVGGSELEYRFDDLVGRDDDKKQVLKVFFDRMLNGNMYMISGTDKYIMDDLYDGNLVGVGEYTKYGSPSSPQYIACDGKVYRKVMGLRNGKNTPVYEEGVLVDGRFYYKSKYDNPFSIGFGSDGSLSVTSYGRCFLESDAFYEVFIKHKYGETPSAKMRFFYGT